MEVKERRSVQRLLKNQSFFHSVPLLVPKSLIDSFPGGTRTRERYSIELVRQECCQYVRIKGVKHLLFKFRVSPENRRNSGVSFIQRVHTKLRSS